MTVVSSSQPGSKSGACVHRVDSGTWEVCLLLVEQTGTSVEGEPVDQHLPVSCGVDFLRPQETQKTGNPRGIG